MAAEMVLFDAERMWVGLSDGRVIGVPLAWRPRLERATPVSRRASSSARSASIGQRWTRNVSVERLLDGRGDRGRVGLRQREKWWVDAPPYIL
jgi:hypothetical protein